ncbi:MAG: glycine cleavage system protein GcvH, partial [Nitrospirota bacterium]
EGKKAVVGITDYAQGELGDIVYIEMPEKDAIVSVNQEIGELESTKTTSPTLAPVSGKIIEVNGELKDSPELINKDPYGRGWILAIEMSNTKDLDQLMDAKGYEAFIKEGEK